MRSTICWSLSWTCKLLLPRWSSSFVFIISIVTFIIVMIMIINIILQAGLEDVLESNHHHHRRRHHHGGSHHGWNHHLYHLMYTFITPVVNVIAGWNNFSITSSFPLKILSSLNYIYRSHVWSVSPIGSNEGDSQSRETSVDYLSWCSKYFWNCASRNQHCIVSETMTEDWQSYWLPALNLNVAQIEKIFWQWIVSSFHGHEGSGQIG